MKKLTTLSLLALLNLTVVSCNTVTSYEKSATTPISTSRYPHSVESYMQQAQSDDLTTKQSALLNAAGRLLVEKQTERAAQVLRQVEIEPLNETQHTQLLLLQAQLAIKNGKAPTALPYLSKITNDAELSTADQQQYHELLAQAYALNGQVINSVSQRIKLQHLLSNGQAQVANNQLIWNTIKEAPPSALHTDTLEDSDPELQGWIRLADINQRYNSQPKELLNQLNAWQQKFPEHPGNSMLQGGTLDVAQESNSAQHIALLLPLSGKFAVSGNAVREGVIAAQQQKNPATTIHAYDTNKTTDITQLYQQAIADGANVVIGPLTKPDVNRLAQYSISVPTLALNYTSTNTQITENFYQFGISPLDEAQAVASKAIQDGRHRAIIIAPNNAWGTQVTNAFSSNWQSLGGKITAKLGYQPKENLNQVIRGFFGVDASSSRQSQLQHVLGRKIQFVPRRREDADMIFLLADPASARQILALLKYYYAGNLPVYSTSFIYSGTTQARQDRDLNGVIFCDVPWILNPDNAQESSSHSRLYALGKDAYELMYQLPRLKQYPQLPLVANTGKLSLQPQHTVKRELAWAQFKDGIAQPLS